MTLRGKTKLNLGQLRPTRSGSIFGFALTGFDWGSGGGRVRHDYEISWKWSGRVSDHYGLKTTILLAWLTITGHGKTEAEWAWEKNVKVNYLPKKESEQ